jgi:hypothetical protein
MIALLLQMYYIQDLLKQPIFDKVVTLTSWC